MKNLFDELSKQVQENKSRWEKIDELLVALKNPHQDKTVESLCNVILLLVEQIRPMQDTSKIKNLQEDINKSLFELTNKLHKR